MYTEGKGEQNKEDDFWMGQGLCVQRGLFRHSRHLLTYPCPKAEYDDNTLVAVMGILASI
jgi:hypothetical protein